MGPTSRHPHPQPAPCATPRKRPRVRERKCYLLSATRNVQEDVMHRRIVAAALCASGQLAAAASGDTALRLPYALRFHFSDTSNLRVLRVAHAQAAGPTSAAGEQLRGASRGLLARSP